MNITTVGFLLFIVTGLIVYYLIPTAWKNKLLLIMSLAFSAFFDLRCLIFIVLVSVSAYVAGLLLDKRSAKEGDYDLMIKKGRAIITLNVVFDVAILFLVKYYNPLVNTIGRIAHFSAEAQGNLRLNLIVPLGISYYTLQAISYVVDVYWQKYKAEKNYFNLLLFISYFPQMVQGPINRYDKMSAEFSKPHTFNIKNIKFGAQLMIWGFIKKLIVADKLSTSVQAVFYDDSVTPYGLTVVIGLIIYGIQLYCDFSGGIDIIRGVSEMFDIELAVNFRQPYFSKSLAEFWQRWHISLGAWMKDYIFYPISMSSPLKKLKKSLKGKVSKHTVNRIPIAIADILVFILVGLWHGAGYKFLAWGIYNGVILAFSNMMTDSYAKGLKRLKINKRSKGWEYFSIFRTLVIVTFGWVFDCTDTPARTLEIVKNMFLLGRTNLSVIGISSSYIWATAVCVLLLVVSIINENGKSVREELSKRSVWIQILIWVLLIQLIPLFFTSGSEGGFMYANF